MLCKWHQTRYVIRVRLPLLWRFCGKSKHKPYYVFSVVWSDCLTSLLCLSLLEFYSSRTFEVNGILSIYLLLFSLQSGVPNKIHGWYHSHWRPFIQLCHKWVRWDVWWYIKSRDVKAEKFLRFNWLGFFYMMEQIKIFFLSVCLILICIKSHSLETLKHAAVMSFNCVANSSHLMSLKSLI